MQSLGLYLLALELCTSIIEIKENGTLVKLSDK